MRFITAFAVLALLQVAPPVPRKTTNKARRSSDNVQTEAKQKNNPATPATIQREESTDSNQQQGQKPSPTNGPEHVIIDNLPKIAGKDDWDKTYIVFAGLLVVIGGITFGAIWYQAKKTAEAAKAAADSVEAINAQAGIMQRQTKAAQDSAEAARDNAVAAKISAEALISAERAWVLADFDYPDRPHTHYEFSLIFTNHGPTPARVESFFWETRAIDSLEELPPIPVYGAVEYSGRLLAPREPWAVDMVFPNAAVSMDRWTEVMKDKNKYVICVGYVRYGGIFEGKRYTRFCFGYNGYVPRFTAVGPPAYNDYT
jgi:hypothetical protein